MGDGILFFSSFALLFLLLILKMSEKVEITEDQVKVLGVDFEKDLFEIGSGFKNVPFPLKGHPDEKNPEKIDGSILRAAYITEELKSAFYNIKSFFDENDAIRLGFFITYNKEISKFVMGFRRILGCDCDIQSSQLSELLGKEIKNSREKKWIYPLRGIVAGFRDDFAAEINDLLDTYSPTSIGDIDYLRGLPNVKTMDIPEEIRKKVTQAVRIGVEKLWCKIDSTQEEKKQTKSPQSKP